MIKLLFGAATAFLKPYLLPIAAGAVASAFVAGIYVDHRWNAVDALRTELKTLRFDVSETTRAAKQADADSELIEAADRANQEKINAAENILARGHACPTAGELRWFNSIGQSGPRANPPAAATLSDTGTTASAQGCDSWPLIAGYERAKVLKLNDKIARGRAAWERMVADFAKGKVAK